MKNTDTFKRDNNIKGLRAWASKLTTHELKLRFDALRTSDALGRIAVLYVVRSELNARGGSNRWPTAM